MNDATPEKISLITTSRDDLFTLARHLARAFNTRAFGDASHPVTVSVCGSWGCGKSIIADAVRDELLGGHAILNGHRGHDERWIGPLDGQTIEVDYFDSAYGGDYSVNDLNNASTAQERTDRFLQQRRYGGVTFVQNDPHFARQADIRIWLEKRKAFCFYGKSHLDSAPPTLRDKLKRADLRYEWSRLVEVDIGNPGVVAGTMAETIANLDWSPGSWLSEAAGTLGERVKRTARKLRVNTALLFASSFKPN